VDGKREAFETPFDPPPWFKSPLDLQTDVTNRMFRGDHFECVATEPAVVEDVMRRSWVNDHLPKRFTRPAALLLVLILGCGSEAREPSPPDVFDTTTGTLLLADPDLTDNCFTGNTFDIEFPPGIVGAFECL
jgi:hypothetical protein